MNSKTGQNFYLILAIVVLVSNIALGLLGRQEIPLALLLGFSALMVLVVVGVMFFLVGHPDIISGQVTSILGKISEGKFQDAVREGENLTSLAQQDAFMNRDKTLELALATKKITEDLRGFADHVGETSLKVSTSSSEISVTAKEIETSMTEQSAASSEVVATVSEISGVAQELVGTMDEVSQLTSQTSEKAEQGRSGLVVMESAMKKLTESSKSISARLAVISDKANAVNSVVETISKVADQTNLLSLNASIQAEQAGEYGRGFSVVAREIRRLADQTAVATLNIEQIVGEMHSAVSSGVMEVDRFSEVMRTGVSNVGVVITHLEQIIEKVQEVDPRFSNINSAMQNQAEGARLINEAMRQLNDGVEQTTESLRDFNDSAVQLNGIATALQSTVSNFTVKD